LSSGGGAVDLAIVGAGAAGLMAAIQAGRTDPGLSIVALDGARTLGAKILVAGGGRCNVTHFEVTAEDFAGSTRPAIAKVLRELPVAATVAFFREIGVDLKREATGKLFPTTDRARTVLDALLRAARAARVDLRFPCRVGEIERGENCFHLRGDRGDLRARRVILAAGGRALPKSGSDGAGVALAVSLGHEPTPDIFPALVPLVVAPGQWLTGLSGIAAPARVEIRSASARKLVAFRGDLLCTHFGLSGPVVLDASRHFLAARLDDPGARFGVAFLPDATAESLEAELAALGRRTLGGWLAAKLPDRLADALLGAAGIEPAATTVRLARSARRTLVGALTALEIPIVGDRGFVHAEATAGGIPLAQVRLDSMESRRSPGLHLCGELLDVDGRIGGFNFQWAWASGAVAGRAAARALAR